MSPLSAYLRLVAVLLAGVLAEPPIPGALPYLYSTFNGPVSGDAQEIMVPGPRVHGQVSNSFDYIAKPDYTFSYGIDDPETGNSQKHEESRDGDVVMGEYSIVEPDGAIRTVYYTADPKNGFQATVERSAPTGTTVQYNGRPNDYPPEPAYHPNEFQRSSQYDAPVSQEYPTAPRSYNENSYPTNPDSDYRGPIKYDNPQSNESEGDY